MRQRMDKGPIPQDLVLKWMLQVSVALHYLHQQHLVHRDIKPDNIFIDENDNAIVGDLGLLSNRFMASTVAGDFKYMAREVVKSQTSETPSYDSRVDVNSLGVVMAELLLGKKPPVDPFSDVEQPIPYKDGVPNELIDIC